MEVKALKNVVHDLPEAKIIIELLNGQRVYASGFWVRKDIDNKSIIIIRASKKNFI